MQTDRYTKFILTLIALSLSVIALRPFISPTAAGAADMSCGLDSRHPCYIAGWGPDGTIPVVNDGRLPLKVLVGNPTHNPVPVVVVNPPTPFTHR